MIILKQILWETKSGFENLIGQVVFELLIIICKILFRSVIQDPLY